MIIANTAATPTNTYTHKLREGLPPRDCMETVVVISIEKMLSVVGDVASTEDRTAGGEDVEWPDWEVDVGVTVDDGTNTVEEEMLPAHLVEAWVKSSNSILLLSPQGFELKTESLAVKVNALLGVNDDVALSTCAWQ